MDLQTQRLMAGAAGAAGDSTIGVEDVFKTYVYTGNDTARSINNGIDLTKGGMVWTKCRSNDSTNHYQFDTERGATKYVKSNQSNAEGSDSNTLTSFNNNGFSLGTDSSSNQNNRTFTSWTFRKQKKFFDVVTYTGSGSAQNISHLLGSVPGMIMVKRVDAGASWRVYHRGIGATKGLKLNASEAEVTSSGYWNDMLPTSSSFTVKDSGETNASGGTYIAYLFAHEEAEFGPDSDQKIISCGSYTGNGSATGPNINLGFESQWIMIKNASSSGNGWMMYDTMRGWFNNADDDRYIMANETSAEAAFDLGHPTSTGFEITTDNSSFNASGDTYIYIVIAAETGKTMKAIETGSDVFAMGTGVHPTVPCFHSGFPVDFGLRRRKDMAEAWITSARLMGESKSLATNSSDAEGNDTNGLFDSNTGYYSGINQYNNAWMWKRHAGFDVVAYVGNGNNTDGANSHAHNLGANNVPEMIWIKTRSGGTHSGVTNWTVGHKDLNGGINPWRSTLILNERNAEAATDNFGNTAPTSSVFYVGEDSNGRSNTSGANFIALLFSSVEEVSKVDGYDGDSNAQDKTISCGFQPRLVIAKCSTVGASYNHWFVFDSTRGAGSGNDKALRLDVNEAQTTNADIIEFTSNGFIVKAGYQLNEGSRKYIYYAHA